ncbi:MAG: hypothetical protein JNK46_08150 [Methylobacteriaceae bacterium]|nr:hypothetical protein [Methylobacteriaceae bacterium]
MSQEIPLGVIALCVAAMGGWYFVRSGGSATVEARVVSVSQQCYLRFERDGATRYSKLGPCEAAKASAQAAPSAAGTLRQTRAVELLYVSPANGAVARATVAESTVSSSPLKQGDVVRIRAKTDRAGVVSAL